MGKETGTQAMFERLAAIFMACVCALGLLAGLGWLFNRPVLASFNSAFIPMAPASALLFLGLCGAWLVQRVFPARRAISRAVQAVLVGLAIIVIILTLRYFTGLGPDLEKLLYPAPPMFGQFSSARMSPLSALGFLLAIPAFLLFTGARPGRPTRNASAALSLALFILSSLICLGYLYGAPLFYGGTLIPVALTSALAFWCLSLGLLVTAGPSAWPVSLFLGPSPRARLMRAFIPASVAFVLIQALLSSEADPWVINPALRVALGAVVALLIVILIISLISHTLGTGFERSQQVEHALRQSETKLRALFAGMTDVVIVYDNDGRYIDIAPTNPANFIRPSAEMLGKKVHEILPKEPADVILTIIRSSIQNNQVASAEYTLRVDGRETCFSASASRLSETTAILVAHDITNRKQAEKALREDEHRISEALEFNRKILNTSSIGILTYKESGQCLSANAAAARITGGTLAQLLAQNFHEIPSWKRSGLYQAALRALDTGIEQLLEVHFVTTFGKDSWLRFSLTPFDSAGERDLLVFVFDITGSKQAEQALVASENKFRWLYEYAPVAYHTLTPDGILTDVNHRWCELLGYRREEVLGKAIFDFVVEQEREATKESFGKKKQSKQSFVEGSERNFRTKDGAVRTFKSYDYFSLDEKQNITSVQTTIEDITERKHNDLIQNAIYRITQAAITSEGMDVLYHSIHTILGELIPAENFFIALIEPNNGEISFPYYVDQIDEPPVGMTPQQGLTGYIIRSGCPLLATREDIERLVQQGQVERLGTVSLDWMGVPLKVEGALIGVMAAQIYTPGTQYDQADLNLLEFVSTQVAQAIQRMRMQEQIRNLSLTDEMTGLYNRRGFSLLAERELNHSRRVRRSMLLFFCDLDGLKSINDRLGHARGDQALKDIANILKQAFREADIPARFGGDELVVLAVDASYESADALTNRIRAALQALNQLPSRPYQLSLSIGNARYDPETPCTLDELIARADAHMYQQKQASKGASPSASPDSDR